MKTIEHCLNHNRFIPIDTEELTALELIGKTVEKTNEVVEKTNEIEELANDNKKNKVSHDDMYKIYKNDKGDHIGSWHGVKSPVMSEPGIQGQVIKIMEELKICPDKFTGTDIEKLQKAYDYCYLNGIKELSLNRTYDITGGSIQMIKDSVLRWKNLLISGGAIVKNDNGYILTCDEEFPKSVERQAPSFSCTHFLSKGKTWLYNGTQCKRQFVDNCVFEGIGLVNALVTPTTGYTQSLRVRGCEFIIQNVDTILAPGTIDTNITDCQIEQTTNTVSFLNNTVNFSNLRIKGCVIEGYTQQVPIKIPTGYALSYLNNYHEANLGNIQITRHSTGSAIIQGEIKGCNFAANREETDILFSDNITRFDKLYIRNNFSNSKFLCNKYVVKDNDTSNYLTVGVITKPYGTSIQTQLKTLPFLQSGETTGNLNFEIPLQLQIDGSLQTSHMRQFLVNIKAQASSSNVTMGFLTGILSIDGYAKTGEGNQHLNLTILACKNLEGSPTGGTSNIINENVLVTFKESGLNNIAGDVINATIVIKVPTWRNTAYSSLTIKPLNDFICDVSMNN